MRPSSPLKDGGSSSRAIAPGSGGTGKAISISTATPASGYGRVHGIFACGRRSSAYSRRGRQMHRVHPPVLGNAAALRRADDQPGVTLGRKASVQVQRYKIRLPKADMTKLSVSAATRSSSAAVSPGHVHRDHASRRARSSPSPDGSRAPSAPPEPSAQPGISVAAGE